MGPEYWKPQAESHLKKCSEFVVSGCDPIPTDLCCAGGIPCTYCLIWTVYGEDDQFGSASFDIDGWYGTIAGAAFRGYWERNYETDECEFVVTLDDEEIYRNDCYGGQSCRDSSDSAEATIGYDDGTLQWIKLEPRPLEYVIDEATNCRTHFCGSCECSCDCLCVVITSTYTTTGEICDVSYPCDSPVWEGVVGDYTLSLALAQDVYGECIIVPTVNGVELDAVDASGCGSMAARITLEDGTTIDVSCKVCGCDQTPTLLCECRLDVDASITGTLTSGGGVCSIDPFSISLINSGAPGIVPEEGIAWLEGWCIYHFTATVRITAFPPLCTDPVTSRLVVIVKKTTSDDAPLIDNTIVGEEDWYLLVYHTDGSGPLQIVYDYSQCCLDATPNDPATSHLVRVSWFDVTILDAVWDVVLLNPTTLATYGDCA